MRPLLVLSGVAGLLMMSVLLVADRQPSSATANHIAAAGFLAGLPWSALTPLLGPSGTTVAVALGAALSMNSFLIGAAALSQVRLAPLRVAAALYGPILLAFGALWLGNASPAHYHRALWTGMPFAMGLILAVGLGVVWQVLPRRPHRAALGLGYLIVEAPALWFVVALQMIGP